MINLAHSFHTYISMVLLNVRLFQTLFYNRLCLISRCEHFISSLIWDI